MAGEEFEVRVERRRAGHLPLIRHVMDQLGIIDVRGELFPKDPRARVSDAQCIGAMVLNVLSGRVALLRMEETLAALDTELILGEGATADAFHDTRLGVALDHLAEVGVENVLGAIIARTLAREERPRSTTVHVDTTSLSLHGVYADDQDFIAFGYSKDHRPNLEQGGRARSHPRAPAHQATREAPHHRGGDVVVPRRADRRRRATRRLLAPLAAEALDGARTILELLDVPLEVFTTPPTRRPVSTSSQRKARVRVEEKSGM